MLFGTIDSLAGLAAPAHSLSPAALGQGKDADGTDVAASHPAGSISSAVSVVDSESPGQTRSSSFGPVPRARYDALVNALHAPYPRGDSRVQAIAAHRQQLPSAAVVKGQGLSVAALCAVLAGSSLSAALGTAALGTTRDDVLPTRHLSGASPVTFSAATASTSALVGTCEVHSKRSREAFERDNLVDDDAARFFKRSRLVSTSPGLDDNASYPPALSFSRSPSPELEEVQTPPMEVIALPDVQLERGIKRSADDFDNDVDITMEPEPKQKVQRVRERIAVPPSRALKRTTTTLLLAAPSTFIDRPAIAASAPTLAPAPFVASCAPKACPTLSESRRLQRMTTTLGQDVLRPLPLQSIDMNRPNRPSRRALKRTTSALSLATPSKPSSQLAKAKALCKTPRQASAVPRKVSESRPLKSCLERYAPPTKPPPALHFNKPGQTWPAFTFFCPIPRSRRTLSDEEKEARKARRDLKASLLCERNPETGLKEFLPRRVPGAEPEPVLESFKDVEPWSEGQSEFAARTAETAELAAMVMETLSLDDVIANLSKLTVVPREKKVVTWGGCQNRFF
ncbi:hypothetical protein L198_07963 [Cryptococcus wingfieldii CBS 7118]|uniref:Uncharacterized protein n=1 Tax=Cryptococcus wingfieldii CBS 7118 TaxID=1295528 RepID=A0A1E3HPC7_9TREE|nr:hypothetical protein L198_07963 [Cryptococcus wingfieldii CBS 7118]ODN78174.1 hypothetical protein L198_07963 [Cryptococcus wingfieldii CBS 7118]